MFFKDRFDAALKLVDRLKQYKNNPEVVVIAIPRGGLELGSVLAKELDVPLDVVFTKKIGYPGNPEFAIGAVSLTDAFIEPRFAQDTLMQEYITAETERVRALLATRARDYHKGRTPISLKNKIVIIVDDGVATGNTMMVTIGLIRKEQPQKIVVALPVAPRDTLERLKKEADEVICLEVPPLFQGVGQFYQRFEQVPDQEAIRLLQGAHKGE